MTEYIYRVDTLASLKRVPGVHFCARRWVPGTYSFPHKLLGEIHSNLPPTEGLYRICFYTSQGRAETSLNNDFKCLGPSCLLRCHKKEVLSRGFKESWDDGFKKGDAYLFWISEPLSLINTEYSSTGMALDLFEVWQEGQWHSLSTFLSQKATASSTLLPQGSKPLYSSRLMKKHWWKFW